MTRRIGLLFPRFEKKIKISFVVRKSSKDDLSSSHKFRNIIFKIHEMLFLRYQIFYNHNNIHLENDVIKILVRRLYTFALSGQERIMFNNLFVVYSIYSEIFSRMT